MQAFCNFTEPLRSIRYVRDGFELPFLQNNPKRDRIEYSF
jgi:hypothetical protein